MSYAKSGMGAGLDFSIGFQQSVDPFHQFNGACPNPQSWFVANSQVRNDLRAFVDTYPGELSDDVISSTLKYMVDCGITIKEASDILIWTQAEIRAARAPKRASADALRRNIYNVTTLQKPVAETSPSGQQQPPVYQPSPSAEESSIPWLWIMLGVGAAGGVAFVMMRKGKATPNLKRRRVRTVAVSALRKKKKRLARQFPRYTSIGSYSIAYLTKKGDVLCHRCAAKEKVKPKAFLHDEGDPLQCDECSASIESSYGPVE